MPAHATDTARLPRHSAAYTQYCFYYLPHALCGLHCPYTLHATDTSRTHKHASSHGRAHVPGTWSSAVPSTYTTHAHTHVSTSPSTHDTMSSKDGSILPMPMTIWKFVDYSEYYCKQSGTLRLAHLSTLEPFTFIYYVLNFPNFHF